MKEQNEDTPIDYALLSPDLVLDAVESLGYLSDLRVLALNSYENRVYQIGIEDDEPLIAKFYRPERWSDAQIKEEHEFSQALAEQEIPVIAPLVSDDTSLFIYRGYRFALYPRRGGYAPELDDLDMLYRFGQQIGRIHAVGAIQAFEHRPAITLTGFGLESRAFIIENDFVPKTLKDAYESVSQHLIDKITPFFEQQFKQIRLHGDCHPGNILTRHEALHFVDFDDARTGPAIQDLWMMLNGARDQKLAQLSSILDGYEAFHEFDPRELSLIEPLRTLRMLHYAGWLAKRWNDPAFPIAFPWFNTERYWADHILELREQMSALDEPALALQ